MSRTYRRRWVWAPNNNGRSNYNNGAWSLKSRVRHHGEHDCPHCRTEACFMHQGRRRERHQAKKDIRNYDY